MASCSCIQLTVRSYVILETCAMQSSVNFPVFIFLYSSSYYPATPYMAAISWYIHNL